MASKLPGGPLRLHPPRPRFLPSALSPSRLQVLPEYEEIAVSRNFTPKIEKLTLFIPVCFYPLAQKLHRTIGEVYYNLTLF